MIRDILLKQKGELEAKRKENYIRRETEIKGLNSDIIKAVTGPRRAGKSFFIIHSLKEKYGYANFDDEELARAKNYDEIIATIDDIYSNPKTIFFDEIQNLDRWELFVNRLQRQGRDILLTGSNSNLLSGELATHLTGRHFETQIYPLSFKEYVEDTKNKTTADIKKEFEKYLRDGGYPEPHVKNLEISEYIKTLFEATLYKDVIKRHRIRKTSEIEAIAEFIVTNAATQMSYNQIAKSLGVKSVETVKKYYNILEETMIFFSLKKFSYKLKEQETESRKVYCIDNGIIKAKAFSTSQNIGKLYENLVAAELKRKEQQTGIKAFYWKNQQHEEVDFVLKKENKIAELIQVCYSLENSKTQEREIRALLKAGKELKCKNLTILNAELEKTENKEWFGIKGKIKFTPLWKWLLEN
ncbi:MAG: AAA family ATPase [Candidatus Diapherotrites archaeon CG11_big_fil_rev_8_21_14_0_20_37_9]|nr:MAG: AAA family ATPase [Candidatus Diapherotrites archaeon CG11_big_fil_rev_8_21_14_0_20_37_9]